ncbi:DUF559 domain-containing protein [Desulfurispirillum indicum]|uniref:DUF559 domain-containing protein n=1 Tax=Desulfurispirillum indicum TaxID=936456 RepID=UPI001CF97294|nr:DUF559 domain-containing protein [Desulfurispirillum indicum]UCZ55558.1 DUF559 domain-containing protein [Desulfurispirillum indicum]
MNNNFSHEGTKTRRSKTTSRQDAKAPKESEENNSPPLEGWQAQPDGVVKRNTKGFMSLPYNPALRDRARQLRKSGMLHEVLLWQQLKKKQFHGLDFDRQKIIGNYIVDFYCASASLVIEIDGCSHNDKVEYDQQRDAYLESLGLHVVHIRAVDVLQNMDGVIQFLTTPALRATPPQEGNQLSQADQATNSPPLEGRQAKPIDVNSPPVEGWQAQPDGVVDGVAKLLEQHFDTAFAAPGGVAKLRELILTLAMQGKLVEQNPNNPPASELLKEIEAEKQRLVKVGKIKKPKPMPPIKPEEVPYELPQGWEWVIFGDIAAIERGGSPRPIKAFLTDDPDGLNWIKIGDTDQGGKYITSTKEKIRPEGLTKTRMVYPGDFLLTNSMSFGRPYITQIEGCIHDGWLRISPPASVDKDYLYHLLSSSFIRRMFEAAAAGAVVLNLNSDKVRELPIPLPPLPEQHRIVARIDQLVARCDALEKLRKEREEKRLAVHAAAIKQLLDPSSSNLRAFVPSCETKESFAFLAQHFGELYTVKENVAELRKAILQLAVMGRLVPQDPNDPPASELLKEIEAEKERASHEGTKTRRKGKELPPIKPEEVPYQLPQSWEWVRFEEIVDIGSGITKGRKLEGRKLISIPYLRVANVQRSYLDLTEIKEIEIPVEEAEKYLLISGDLLITEGGDWDKVGRTCIWMEEIPLCGHQNHVFRARKVLLKQNEIWLEKYLNSTTARDYFAGASKQTTNLASINKTQLRGCPIPLPPLPEQHRIVARIDQLMALCDTLDQQIDAANQKQSELLDSVMGAI